MYCIYHSRDLDGYCSGAIVKKKYPEAVLIGFDYGQGLKKLVDQIPADATVIMVDVSLPIYEMGELAAMVDRFIWIDHHKSAIDDYNNHMEAKHPNGTNVRLIEPVLEDGIAACEATWKYLFPDKHMPIAVKLLGMYDTWRNQDIEEWNNKILPFQYGMRLNTSSAENFNMTLLSFKADGDSIIDIVYRGDTILAYQKQQNKISMRGSFVADFKGYRALCCNGSGFNSQAFESVWDEDKHDIMMPFKYDGKKWTFSLYTTKDIDCSALAKEMGGGGHKKAAGFMTEMLPDFILTNN